MDDTPLYADMKNRLGNVKDLFAKFVDVTNRINILRSESDIHREGCPSNILCDSQKCNYSIVNAGAAEYAEAEKSEVSVIDAKVDSKMNLCATTHVEVAKSVTDGTEHSVINLKTSTQVRSALIVQSDIVDLSHLETALEMTEISHESSTPSTVGDFGSKEVESVSDNVAACWNESHVIGIELRDESMFCESRLDEVLTNPSIDNQDQESQTTLKNYFYYLYDTNDVAYASNELNGPDGCNDENTTCQSLNMNDCGNAFEVGMFHDMDICNSGDDVFVSSPESHVLLNLTESIVQNGTKAKGSKVNGTKLNGTKLNGTKVNGTKVNGTKINGTKVNGTKVNGTKVNGSSATNLKKQRSNGNGLNANPSPPVVGPPNHTHQEVRRGCDKTKMFVPTSDQGTKKLCCIYCLNRYPKLARHILSVHKNEDEVKNILALPAGSKERMAHLHRLRKRGEFKWNEDESINLGELLTSRRPNGKYRRKATDNETCANCLGSYSSKGLRLHFNKCTNQQFAGERIAKEKSRQVEARAHVEACQELVDVVFPSLRQNKAALSIRFDWIVIKFANSKCFNLSPHNQLPVVQRYVRNAGQLLTIARSICGDISDFASLYNVKHSDVVIDAIRIIAKYDTTLKAFKSPGTATTFVTLVNNIGEFLRTEYMRLNNDGEKAVFRFLRVFQQDAKTKINKMAMLNRLQVRREKPVIIPTDEDVEKLATYLDSERTSAFSSLSQEYSPNVWRRLMEFTSISILVFNRKRVGDTQNILVTDFRNREIVNIPESSEEVDVKSRIKLRGKLYRTVPVLLKDCFDECLKLVLQYREKAMVPECNKYMFGLPSKTGKIIRIRADALLNDYSKKCGATNPRSLTGTNLRKHFASLCSTLDLSHTDIGNIAKFMGHTDQVHWDVYRHNPLQHEVIQMSNLLNIAQGKSSRNSNNTQAAPSNGDQQPKRKTKRIVAPRYPKKRNS